MALLDLTNEELGAKVRVDHQRHLERVEKLKPQWIKEGLIAREHRKKAKLSQQKLGELVGVSAQVISKYERGLSICSRNLLQRACNIAIENEALIGALQVICKITEGKKNEQ